jgi:Zn-finger nucleic acid-binding protein
MMNCPRCSLPLSEVDLGELGGEYAAVVIDACPDCGGVWFDKGELDQRDESVWTDVEALEFEVVTGDRVAALCPRCSVDLLSIAPSDLPRLVIDRCPECWGFWLDSGELESVQEMAADLDSETMGAMTHTLRPPDWSWIKWAVYCAKGHFRREGLL